jgi:hypothetical protein
MAAKAKAVTLHHTQLEGLHYGANDEIVFGLKGGFAPGEWSGPTDHPLYDALWAAEGSFLEVVDKSGPAKVYVSPLDPSLEFKSRQAMLAHVREAGRSGSAMAQMWLEQNAKAAAAAEAAEEAAEE